MLTHSVIHEEEFFDAVDATLDKLEKEEEKVRMKKALVTNPSYKRYYL